MQELNADNISDAELRAKVTAIPGRIVSQLRAIEAFKPVQSWALFRAPGTLMRTETLQLGKTFEDVTSKRSGRKVARKVLLGARGSGKSIHLLQAMTMAFLRGWVVINIPEGLHTSEVLSQAFSNAHAAQDLTNAHTEYSPVPGSSPTIYFQRAYTASLLSRINVANPQLASMQISLSHDLPISLQGNLSLSRLCTLGSQDSAISHPIFNALMAELLAPSRPPLLITLDGFQHIMKQSAYMSPSFVPIHAHDLHLPRWFLSHLTGEVDLPNGGIVIAANTESNKPSAPTLDFRLRQLEAQQALALGLQVTSPQVHLTPFLDATGQIASPIPEPDPYFRYDQRVLDVLAAREISISASLTESKQSLGSPTKGSDIEVQRLRGLSKEEAKGLMDYWALSGMLRQEVSERLVGEKWTISGGGIVGELERGCVGMRI